MTRDPLSAPQVIYYHDPEIAVAMHSSFSNAIHEADRCVSCGLCLQNCPTYRKTLSEADSPRGRINLMRGVMKEEIPLNARFIEHIDLCLDCRACEKACPNHVAYDAILRAMRKPIEKEKKGRRLLKRASLNLLSRPEMLERIGRLYLKSGMGRFLPGKLKPLDTLLPRGLPGFPEKTVYPAQGEALGEVGLFLGCVARLTDTLTLNAAIHVLNRLGYTVHVPQDQTCCGALHARFGENAEPLVTRNLEAFSGIDVVLGTSSACTVELSSFFQGRIFDISRFLCEAKGWERMEISPFEGKIAVHEPCSLRNVLKGQDYPYRLLERIPGASVVPLEGNGQCCGSAGSYFLTQPEMANSLLDDKMEMVCKSGARIIATSNVGCAMFMGARGAGVLHPVVILARQTGFGK